MGISYFDDKKKLNYLKYNQIIKKFLKKNKCKIILEPGRSITGSMGILISKIIYIKENKSKNFIILDAAMNDFMRPALYGAKHKIIPVVRKNDCQSRSEALRLRRATRIARRRLPAAGRGAGGRKGGGCFRGEGRWQGGGRGRRSARERARRL